MITIKYEKYYHYRREHETKAFRNLTELENWIFDSMKREYINDWCAMSFPTVEKANRIKSDGPWAIEFRPERGGVIYLIHQINNGNGIIFTDGMHTNQQKHWSKDVKEWLDGCEQRRKHQKFTFVD